MEESLELTKGCIAHLREGEDEELYIADSHCIYSFTPLEPKQSIIHLHVKANELDCTQKQTSIPR